LATSQLRLHHDMISSTEGTGAQRMDESGAPSTRNPGFGVRGGPPPRGRPSESGTAAEDPIRCCARTIQSPGPPGLARTSTSHRPAHSAIGRIFFSIIRSTPWHRGVSYHAESTLSSAQVLKVHTLNTVCDVSFLFLFNLSVWELGQRSVVKRCRTFP